MKCQNCSREISRNDKFCPFCGTRVNAPASVQKQQGVKCSACGAEMQGGEAFCMNCGTRMPAAQNAQQPAREAPPRPAQAPKLVPARPVQSAKCPACGADAPLGQAFCMNCGARIPDRQNASAGAGQPQQMQGQQYQQPSYAQPVAPPQQQYNGQAQYQSQAAAGGASYGNQPYPAGPRPNPGGMLKGAGVGIRFLATLLDGILVTVVMGLFMGGRFTTQMNQMSYGGVIDLTMYIMPSLIVFAYYILMEGLIGATLGKMVCGLRVVTKDGINCGIGKSVIRNLLRIIDAMFGYLIGAICVWVSTDNQRLGDMVAGTLVVKKGDIVMR